MGNAYRDHSAEIGAIVAAHASGRRVRSVVRLGEGQDNVAYEVDGELIVRFGKEPDPKERAARVDADLRLLRAVAEISPVPVPVPLFAVADRGCLAYSRLPGLPLIDLPARERAVHAGPVAVVLGGFLTALHRVPTGAMSGLAGVDDQPKELWLCEAGDTYAAVADHVPEAHRAAVEAFLAAPPPDDGHPAAFSHNDLGIEHVLVDPATWEVTGVIDWSDAAITDPAHDFGLLYRDLGPDLLDLALRNYRNDAQDPEEFRTRAVFYARCAALEDLAYGIEPGHGKYLDKSLDSLRWLFPSRPER
ncbi:phosphotransferase family protein [Actinocorallia populi]|uniref:phosphotransferase family protein n=1 Tax=Actinocorallia populi TaxID=2079200 RepID=UPI000D090D9E|nr:aminoglycoside phosphotransferase family protein [Actinocorallia populi]